LLPSVRLAVVDGPASRGRSLTAGTAPHRCSPGRRSWPGAMPTLRLGGSRSGRQRQPVFHRTIDARSDLSIEAPSTTDLEPVGIDHAVLAYLHRDRFMIYVGLDEIPDGGYDREDQRLGWDWTPHLLWGSGKDIRPSGSTTRCPRNIEMRRWNALPLGDGDSCGTSGGSVPR
jgi:hypothetical protein